MTRAECLAAAYGALRAAKRARERGDGANAAVWLEMVARWRGTVVMMDGWGIDVLPPF